tara:strand:- start:403 stop:597 length:195 start_codon:yes stop_codon:yes gene_type:complete
MPYRSEILSDIFIKNQNYFDEMFKDIEKMCIHSDFSILNNMTSNSKADFYSLIIDNLNIKSHLK